MMVRALLWVLPILGCLFRPALAQASREIPAGPDIRLQELLEAQVQGFHGDVGIYVRHLSTGRTASMRADELFPTASLIKVPILITVFDRLERRQLDWRARLVYRRSMLYPGEDIVGLFRDGSRIDLSKLILLMITTSDNTAALWLQALAGGGAAVNQWLEQNGFPQTRVNSRTPGRATEREKYGWGQTTPREMAEFLVQAREGRLVSRAASEEIYRILTRSYWNGEALSQLPPEIQAASKQGSINRSRSEVVLVNAPSGDYVFCLITKNQQDIRDAPENEGFVLLRGVSALLWKYFEPERPWKPDPDARRFKP